MRTNDHLQSFRPLVSSIVDQFLTAHVPTAVQDLFQMVSVLDFLTTYAYQLLKSTRN